MSFFNPCNLVKLFWLPEPSNTSSTLSFSGIFEHIILIACFPILPFAPIYVIFCISISFHCCFAFVNNSINSLAFLIIVIGLLLILDKLFTFFKKISFSFFSSKIKIGIKEYLNECFISSKLFPIFIIFSSNGSKSISSRYFFILLFSELLIISLKYSLILKFSKNFSINELSLSNIRIKLILFSWIKVKNFTISPIKDNLEILSIKILLNSSYAFSNNSSPK